MKWLHILCPWCRRPTVAEALEADLYETEMALRRAVWEGEGWNSQVALLQGRASRLREALHGKRAPTLTETLLPK